MKQLLNCEPVMFVAGLIFVVLSAIGVNGLLGPAPEAWAPVVFQATGSAAACFWGELAYAS